MCEERCCADPKCSVWHFGTTLPVDGVGCVRGAPSRCVGGSQVVAAGGKRASPAESSEGDTTGNVPEHSGGGATEQLAVLGVSALVAVCCCAVGVRYRHARLKGDKTVHPHQLVMRAAEARNGAVGEGNQRMDVPAPVVEGRVWATRGPPHVPHKPTKRAADPQAKLRTGSIVDRAQHQLREPREKMQSVVPHGGAPNGDATVLGGKWAQARASAHPSESAALADDLLAAAMGESFASKSAGNAWARSHQAADLRAEDI